MYSLSASIASTALQKIVSLKISSSHSLEDLPQHEPRQTPGCQVPSGLQKQTYTKNATSRVDESPTRYKVTGFATYQQHTQAAHRLNQASSFASSSAACKLFLTS